MTPKQVVELRRAQSKPALSVGTSTLSSAEGTQPSNVTRIIHLLLLLAVLNQLISSQFIGRPVPGDAPSLLFSLHEYVGLGTFLVVFAFWVWTLVRSGETKLAKLIPWFAVARLHDVVQDLLSELRHLRRGEFVDSRGGAVASAVHGLGLLVVTGMALTGVVYFFSRGSALAHWALDLHSLMANLMWAYLIGHASLAALHHLLGSDILARMFWLRRGTSGSLLPPWRREGARNTDIA